MRFTIHTTDQHGNEGIFVSEVPSRSLADKIATGLEDLGHPTHVEEE